MAYRHSRGTNARPPPATPQQPRPPPHSTNHRRSPPRIDAVPHAVPLAVDQASASVLALRDRPVAASLLPSELLVVEALRRPVESAQYLSIRYTERLAAAGIEPSVGSVGDSYDNALAESVIGLYKTEVVRRQGPWRHVEAVEFATLAWVDWFNTRRLLAPIGYVPPIEFEDAYYREQHCQTTPAMGAGIM